MNETKLESCETLADVLHFVGEGCYATRHPRQGAVVARNTVAGMKWLAWSVLPDGLTTLHAGYWRDDQPRIFPAWLPEERYRVCGCGHADCFKVEVYVSTEDLTAYRASLERVIKWFIED